MRPALLVCVLVSCTSRDGYEVYCGATPHLACFDGSIYWHDGCDTPLRLYQDCGGKGCADGACRPEAWFGLGGSELAPWSTRVVWDSARGAGVSASFRGSVTPSLAVDSLDRPVVAWRENTGAVIAQIYVRRFEGGAWAELGGSASHDGISRTPAASQWPSLAIGAGGEPMVAWSEGGEEIFVRAWTGSDWEELGGSASGGGISNTSAGSRWPKLLLDGTGAPTVVWVDDGSGVPQIYARRFDGSAWAEVAPGSASGTGISGAATEVEVPAAVLDANDRLVVAWSENDPPYNIHVVRLVSGSWQEVGAGSASAGGVSQTAGNSGGPSLVLGGGDLYLAWADGTAGNREVLVRRFDGASWVEVGSGSAAPAGISRNSGNSDTPTIVFDGAPVVVWEDATPGRDAVFSARFDGSAWVETRAGSTSGLGIAGNGPIDVPAAAVSSAGVLVAWSWIGLPSWYEIHAATLDGAGLGRTTGSGGGISSSPVSAIRPCLAFADDGALLVAWSAGLPPETDIHVARFDGSEWVELGGPLGVSVEVESAQPAIAAGGGEVVVAWGDVWDGVYQIYVRRFDGAQWVEAGVGSAVGGGVSQSGVDSTGPALVLDDAARPILVWAEAVAGVRQIYVRRFDGNAWQELGGSASGGGISDTAGNSDTASITIDGSGRPVVAWEDVTPGFDRVFVRRFDGSAWVELPAGSATTGVSHEASDAPRISTCRDGQPVLTWMEELASGYQVRVARFDGAAWVMLGESVTTSSGASTVPGVVVDANDRPVVAWSEPVDVTREIYVARFDGGAWVDLHAGSASAGGVSNSAAASRIPSIAAGHGMICVAWQEPADPMEQIVLRCTEDR